MLSLERTVMALAKDRLQEPQRQGVSQSLCSELALTTTYSFSFLSFLFFFFFFGFAQIPQRYITYINSLVVVFSHSVMSDSLQPHGLQHARLPCPSAFPGVCSHSCPLNRWCHPTISSSVVPFSSCLQSFPASGSFPMSQLFASSGRHIGASPSVISFFPMNIQGWFPLGLTGLISFFSKGLSRVFSSIKVRKHQFFSARPSLWSNSHIHMTWNVKTLISHMTTGKTIVW